VVCVAVEGGPGTLETVADAVQEGTPVVIVKVSQHCVVCNVADILLHKNTKNSQKWRTIAIPVFWQFQMFFFSKITSHHYRPAYMYNNGHLARQH